MDTSPLPPGVDLLVALVLVLLNGYFVAAEFALVKVRASRLDPIGSCQASALQLGSKS